MPSGNLSFCALTACPNLPDSPLSMFCDQFMLVQGSLVKGIEILRRSDIPQNHAHISEERGALDPLDRRFGKEQPELCIVQLEHIAELHGEDTFPRLKRCLVGDLRELIPRAGGQAFVAAVKSVANGLTKFQRDAAFVLNREIRDTASGIHSMRRSDGIRRARIHASGAFTTKVLRR